MASHVLRTGSAHIFPIVLEGPPGHSARGAIPFMPSAKNDARWSEAIIVTVALWSFVLLIFLPVIMDRHTGDGITSILLDSSTILVSMLFGLAMFIVFRMTADMPAGVRAVLLLATVVSVSVLQTGFDALFQGWVADNLRQSWTALPATMARRLDAALKYMCVFAVNMGLFQLYFYRRQERSRERQLAEAQSAAQEAQLAALRYQLNPHFLFNTLNAISSMIMSRRNEEAEEMTDRLSSFLRNSLAFDPTELVPIEDELALIEEYLEIEGVRFGERLRVEIDCTGEAGRVPVPGFLIQPLVENAIKYGVARSIDPVTITITALIMGEELMISVADDGIAAPGQGSSGGTGTGLVNVRKRLDVIYGRAARIVAGPVDTGFAAIIHIPIRPERTGTYLRT